MQAIFLKTSEIV